MSRDWRAQTGDRLTETLMSRARGLLRAYIRSGEDTGGHYSPIKGERLVVNSLEEGAQI